jgi:hypothetical protein
LRVTWQARDELTKQLAVSDRLVACDAVRPAPGFRNEWRYPSEPRLPADAPIEAIEVVYPSRSIRLAGLDLPWAVVFLGFTVLFALCGRPLFGVTF